MKSICRRARIIYLLSSIAFTLYIGYIDEGHNSFVGLFSQQNIPALLIYALLFWTIQFFIDEVLLRNFKSRLKPFIIIFCLVCSLLLFVYC